MPLDLAQLCGHAAIANSPAIALLTDEDRRAGNPETGLYTENDIAAFHRQIPAPTEEEQERAALAACGLALHTGITSVHTLLDTPDQMSTWSALSRKRQLPIRVVGIPPYDAIEALHRHGIRTGFGDDRLRFGKTVLQVKVILKKRTGVQK